MTGAHPLQHPHHMQRSAARRLGSSLGGDPPQQRAACKVDAETASRRIAAAYTRLGPHPPANQDNTGRVHAALAYYYAPSSSPRQLMSAGTHSCCHSQHRSTQPGMRRREDDSPARPPDNTQIASTPILKERTSVACVVIVLLEQSQEEPEQHSARTTEGYHTNNCSVNKPNQMHNEKQIAGLHRKWNAKGSPRVAKCLEMHQAMQVYTFNRKSTFSIMCLSCQGVDYQLCLVFSCGLTSVPFTSFGYPLCLSASMHTILSKSIDLLVLRANGY